MTQYSNLELNLPKQIYLIRFGVEEQLGVI